VNWQNVLKVKQLGNMTKIVNISWDREGDELPKTQFVPTRLIEDKERILQILSDKYHAIALDFELHDWF